MFEKSRIIVGIVLATVAMVAGATLANNANAAESGSVCDMIDWSDTLRDGVKVQPTDANGDDMIDCTSKIELGIG